MHYFHTLGRLFLVLLNKSSNLKGKKLQLKHINNDSTSLIIFFCGFYTDYNCFLEFDNKKSDILFVYDYSDMDLDDLKYFDFSFYTQIDLIAYSYGVWASNFVYNQNILPEINSSTALCGTFYPINNQYGVSEKIYGLMLNSLNSSTIEKFEKNMQVGSNSPIDIKKADRTIENLKDELVNIQKLSATKLDKEFEFDKVVVAKKDRIIPHSSQMNFWANHRNIVELNCSHFPFFEFNNLQEVLD